MDKGGRGEADGAVENIAEQEEEEEAVPAAAEKQQERNLG